MDMIQNIFKSGNIPDRSVIITAPAGYSKLIWAYSCMQYAITNGFSVAPLLDTTEIKRLLVLAGERPLQQGLKREKNESFGVSSIEYEEYIEKDVLFFTVTKMEQRRGAAPIIAELLDKRARRGKGIIGISRFSVLEMSQWDGLGLYSAWREPIDPIDPFKMPTIISCI